MRIHENLIVLPLAVERGGQKSIFNLALLLDDANGATLVDTGLPGQAGAIGALLAQSSVEVGNLKRIIITHQDIDHVGALAELATRSGAEVLALDVETPMIDGTQTPRFLRPEILEQRPEMRAVAEHFRPTPVDRQLHDGERLDLAGGVRVVATPGHTPGHMCLYHEPSQTLIAADALTAQDGTLNGPNQGATLDLAQAAQSIAKLAALDIATIVCYHGGVVQNDAGAQLRRVAGEASGAQAAHD